jgi:hypothetical protein
MLSDEAFLTLCSSVSVFIFKKVPYPYFNGKLFFSKCSMKQKRFSLIAHSLSGSI